MPRRTHCADREIPAIVELGTESVEWVRDEFTGVDLRDKRLVVV
jgi:hypothetical protein